MRSCGRAVDRGRITGHNQAVHRVIFAIGLAALLWATSARSGPAASPDSIRMSGAESCAVAGASHGSGDSDRQWRNAHHAIAIVTESVWKSAPVHAELGATESARIFEVARSVSSSDPPSPSAPIYLRHTPLLI